jgi:hypothetical protein
MRSIEINNITDNVYSGGLMTFSADVWFAKMVCWLVVILVMIVWPWVFVMIVRLTVFNKKIALQYCMFLFK